MTRSVVAAPPSSRPDQLWLQVELDDPAATLVINGQPTQRLGLVRDFVSPSLPSGHYRYEVAAHYGAAVARATVDFQPGQVVRLRLPRPAVTD